MTGYNFAGHDLTGSNFREAILKDCKFDNTTLHYCNFKDADITGASFLGAKAKYSAWLPKHLAGIDFETEPPLETKRREIQEKIEKIYTESIENSKKNKK
jgi:hypothetical protein